MTIMQSNKLKKEIICLYDRLGGRHWAIQYINNSKMSITTIKLVMSAYLSPEAKSYFMKCYGFDDNGCMRIHSTIDKNNCIITNLASWKAYNHN